MADLHTRWLGLDLAHPLVVGASPLSDHPDEARRLEDAGAAAIVARSLFEEQVAATPYGDTAVMGPGEYVEHIWKLKQAVRIPVLGSLNGSAFGPWLEQARHIEKAGADALELNLYSVATDPWDPPQVLERRMLEVVRAVRSLVHIPVSVKLCPYFTSLPYLVQGLEEAGADGVVLFNRSYPPDVDIDKAAVVRAPRLSDPSELLLRLQHAALLAGRFKGSIAVSGGVQSGVDALKAVACGAHAVQVVSALLRHGPGELKRMKEAMTSWMEQRGLSSLAAWRGSLSQLQCPDPHAWERTHYRKVLQAPLH